MNLWLVKDLFTSSETSKPWREAQSQVWCSVALETVQNKWITLLRAASCCVARGGHAFKDNWSSKPWGYSRNNLQSGFLLPGGQMSHWGVQGAGFSTGDSRHSSEQEKWWTCVTLSMTFCLYIRFSDFSVQSTVSTRAACFPSAVNVYASPISLLLGDRLLLIVFLSEVGNFCYRILKACKRNVAS